MFNALSQLRTVSALRSVAAARVNDVCAPVSFYFGYLVLATGAPDTHTAPTLNGSPPEISQPPVGFPTGGFVFSAPHIFSDTPDNQRIQQ